MIKNTREEERDITRMSLISMPHTFTFNERESELPKMT